MRDREPAKMHGLDLNDSELDRQLESQDRIRLAVKDLPEEQLSLTWRSALNEKLVVQVRARQRRRLFAWVVSPALGLGLAGAIAALVIAKTPTPPASSYASNNSQLEQSLISAYQDSMRYTDITGVGLNQEEVVSRRSVPVQMDFVDFEIGSL